jgi:flavin-dependent dehydrogenase
MNRDALVIGGGPAGATAALLLARAGWSVVLVEKKVFPRRKVCGEFMSATTLPLLRELGIAEEFLARAGPEVRRVGLFAQDTVLDALMPEPGQAAGRFGHALGREHFDLMLVDKARRAGAEVWQPATATGLRRTPGGHVCTVATEEGERAVQARVVIAAHGSWERNILPGAHPAPHRASDLIAFKAHFREAGLPPDLMPLLVFPGGYGGMVRSDGDRVSLSCCIRRDTLQHCRQRWPRAHAGAAVLAHIVDGNRGVRQTLRRARLDGGWLSAGPIRPGMRNREAGGIFLVGNIAGEAHPIVAEGISMAMQSAWLLTRHLIARQDEIASGRAWAEVGAAYGAAWRAQFATRVRAAAVFAQLAMRPSVVAAGLPLMRRFPGLLTFGAELSGKARRLDAA